VKSAASNQRLQINKLDVALRQLRTSIRLWFYDDDPVSAHSLAYAAYTVIDDVTKARNPNRPGLLFDSPYLTRDERKLFNIVYRKAANFFKHADRDPLDKLNFSPDQTRIFLCFAIYALELTGERLANELLIFQAWLVINNPGLRSEEGRKIFTESFLIKYADLRTMPKQEFFEFLLVSLRRHDT
jgi:hypothetical protein